MAAFYSNLAQQQESKELKGKIALKAAQFDDSVAQEMRFLDFVRDLQLDDPVLWRGKDD